MKSTRLYKFITIVITLCLLSSCGSSVSDEKATASDKRTISLETIANADRLFGERKDIAKLREAIAILERARNENQKSYEVEWKLARNKYFLGRHTDDDKESETAFEDGKAVAKSAMQMEPNKPDGHFWYGANLGQQANRNPLTVGLKSIDEIRSVMNRVIELQPDYELASAYDVLGQMELRTRLMGGGKTEKAVEYLEKAVALEPNNGNVRIHLAEALLALKRNAEAKRQLEYLLQMKPHSNYILEYEKQVIEAKELLRTKF
ncbi:MAG: TRAP transporter TatT component family protein [Pyrinomonadaceae bacterium]